MNRFLIKKINLNAYSLIYDEWLVTNGLGGFACGSISGIPMRKYHSLLVSSLSAPFGRTSMLNYVADKVILPNKKEYVLSPIRQMPDEKIPSVPIIEFHLEGGLPVWLFKFDNYILEKKLFLIHRQNTLHVSYKLEEGETPVEIQWRPYFQFRLNEHAPDFKHDHYIVHAEDDRYEIECEPFPRLKLYSSDHPAFTISNHSIDKLYYELEETRGYPAYGNLTSPGFYTMNLHPHNKVTFVASTEPWKNILALSPSEAMSIERLRRKKLLKKAGSIIDSPAVANLVLGADQFIMTPSSRYEDVIRLQAAGEEVKSIIAGYPWFNDWGRDTMISLEGLTLATGRYSEAHSILRTFAYYVKDGLIPNMFPDGENQGIYNTADATLWFFHAVERYIDITKDDDILEFLLPKFNEIIRAHIQGTAFGIKMDKDGLLMQGQKGYQLTWMDAKVGDWVVTPRRGKAVEINALWYNALKLMEKWTGKNLEFTERCYDSFNQRFWYEQGQYLYDVIDGENGNDNAFRPNQLFSISLDYPVLEKGRWKVVVDNVAKELLTPLGLRTLSPKHPDYKATYDGDLRARDAAYHQGTVWPWLMGPFIDAWLKVYPHDLDRAKSFLKVLETHIQDNCIGSIGEIFDACEPFYARGCFAQAWSVAEVLRCILKLNPDLKNESQLLEKRIKINV